MQQHRQATRPQIASALGLSLVSTNAAVAALEKEGVLFPGELVPSGGGRPVREYHFTPGHAAVVLITATPEAHCTQLRCELLNLHGQQIELHEARFVQLHAESLDEWLDAAARHHKLQRICLPPGLGSSILHHLQQRHACPVREYSAAESLVNGQDDTLTLLLLRGQPPQGALHRHGHVTPCPPRGKRSTTQTTPWWRKCSPDCSSCSPAPWHPPTSNCTQISGTTASSHA